MSSDYKGNF